jgi:hypothetical protein
MSCLFGKYSGQISVKRLTILPQIFWQIIKSGNRKILKYVTVSCNFTVFNFTVRRHSFVISGVS